MKYILYIFIVRIYRTFIFPIKKLYVEFSKKVIIDTKAYFDRQCILEGRNYIGLESFISKIYLSYGSYIAERSVLYDMKIGKYTSIGSGVMTAVGRHPVNENISTCPSFFSIRPQTNLQYSKVQLFQEAKPNDEYEILVGNDVWIGNRVILLQGIKIGDGAIIGAGAVVTKDVPPYSVWAGNPAKEIKKRFTEQEIELLLKLQWWNKKEEWIKEQVSLFSQPSTFLRVYMDGEKKE